MKMKNEKCKNRIEIRRNFKGNVRECEENRRDVREKEREGVRGITGVGNSG